MSKRRNIFMRMAGWGSTRPQANTYSGPLSLEQISDIINGAPSKSGLPVSPATAMNLSFVFQCVQVLRQSVAQMSLLTLERLTGPEGGKKRAMDHPLFWLLFMAPDTVTPTSIFQVKQMIMTSMLLRGNFYAAIIRNARGDVIQLWPLNNDRVEPFRNKDTRKKEFRVTLDNGETKIWQSSRILHIMDFTEDGIIGISRIKQNRDVIGISKQAENFGSEFFANGAHPGLSVSTDKHMSPEGVKQFLKELKEKTNAEGTWWSPIVLDEGMKWTSPSMDTDDIQLLSTRKFQKTEIGAMFRVPEHMINDLDGASLTNIGSLTLSFVTLNLMPNLVNIENEMMLQLLSEDDQKIFIIEFLAESLLRGDPLTRAKIHQIEILTGYGTPNEARVMENKEPMNGASELRMPLNVVMLDENGDPVSITMAEGGNEQAALKILAERTRN